MGSNAIIAIVVGAIVVVVGFNLWPVLNAASNNLYSYFRDSCSSTSENRFTKVYVGVTGNDPKADEYSTDAGIHGGRGANLSEQTGIVVTAAGAVNDDCEATIAAPPGISLPYDYPVVQAGITEVIVPIALYNEYGDSLGSVSIAIQTAVETEDKGNGRLEIPEGTAILIEELGLSTSRSLTGDVVAIQGSRPPASGVAAPDTGDYSASLEEWDGGYKWIEVAAMLKRFSGINNLLLTILPVISIAGFLGVSGAKLYTYGKGASNIGSAISTSIFTLIAVVVAMVIAAPILGSVVDANQVVVSGQFQVNGAFANIITLLFAMIPVIYVAGLVTLVGLQAKSALVGGKGFM